MATNSPPASPKPRIGPIDRVPCPSCGKTSDLRPLRDAGGLLERGCEVSCDHCGCYALVLAVHQVQMVKRVQDPKGRRRQPSTAARPAAPAAAANPRLQRMLRPMRRG